MTAVIEPAIDIWDPALYNDPWETYRWLRNNAPIYKAPVDRYFSQHDTNLYVISRHEDISAIERTPEIFSNADGVRPVPADMSLIAMDAPEHTAHRRLINKGFTPRMVGRIRDHVEDVTIEILDEIKAKGSIDFVEDFSCHIPLIVIAELMGMPPEDRADLYRWSDDMMGGDGHMDPDDPVIQRATNAFGEWIPYVQQHVAEKKVNPTNDLISILTGAFSEEFGTDAEDVIEDDELLMFLTLLIVAGNETTRNGISGGLIALSENPDQRDKLVANIRDQEYVNRAVEEVLRYYSPVLSFLRTVKQPYEYKGTQFETGDKVLVLYQSANRDEDVFEDADVFDIERDHNPHIAFGIGPHFCLGANLARMEMQVVFRHLFDVLPDIATTGRLAHRGPSRLVTRIEHLPATFTPVTG